MQRARFWILCAIGALVAASGILLFSAHYWSVSVDSLRNMLPAEVDMRLDRLVLNEAGDSGRVMVINADSAQYYKTRDLFMLHRVRARVLTDESDYLIEADDGRYARGLGTAHLTGSVRVVAPDGGVLTCEALTLKFQEDLLTSEGPFCYSTPTSDLEGASFVYHTRDKRLTVEGRARLLAEGGPARR